LAYIFAAESISVSSTTSM